MRLVGGFLCHGVLHVWLIGCGRSATLDPVPTAIASDSGGNAGRSAAGSAGKSPDSGGGGASAASGGADSGVTDASDDPCSSLPCDNGGTCRSERGAQRCDCAAGFVGERCELPLFEVLTRAAGSPFARPNAISNDGRVVVGVDYEFVQGFRWTSESGLVILPLFGDDQNSYAADVSGDGRVIVGFGGEYYVARIWIDGEARAPELFPDLVQSRALGANLDGSVIMGWSRNTDGEELGFVWRRGDAPEPLLVPADLIDPYPAAISDDGMVVVGTAAAGVEDVALRWVDRQPAILGLLPDSTSCSADAVSADGGVIAGNCSSAHLPYRAFRYADERMTELPPIDGHQQAVVSGVSSDGTVLVGMSSADVGTAHDAVIWDDAGVHELAELLARAGAELDGWRLTRVSDVSSDGKTLVGNGVDPRGNPAGWIARLP